MLRTLTALAALTLLTPLAHADAHAEAAAKEATLNENTTIRYDDFGAPANADAPPVVFIHGWASGREFWHKQTEPLSKSRRVIAIDLPGHGESDQPEAEHSMDLYADAIAAVLDDAGVKKAVLVGHSNGTPTVRQFERRYPKRTAGLVAVDGALKSVFPAEMAAPMLAQIKGENYEQFVAQMFTPMSAMLAHPEDAEMIMQRMQATPQRTLVGGMEASLDDAIWTDDPVSVPLLVVNAPNPMFWTTDYEAHVKTLSDDVEYTVLKGVSHFLMMDDPETFNTMLTDWLDRHGW